MEKFYITTPIYYVNDKPHIGHAYTSIATDIIARYHRLNGKQVLFLTGTDEHGQKIAQTAKNHGITPQELTDKFSQAFRNLSGSFNLSNDKFIRTTEESHKKAVLALWKKLEENGSIYLGKYSGWYSVRDEAFYQESELIDGKAPTGAPVEWVEEESYFFKLSAWEEKLLEFYDNNPDFIWPNSRRNEVTSFVKSGLKDLSISRTSFDWGIKVPGNEKHVVYVWLDALTNYISALGYPEESYKDYWPANIHVVGKDILRFHAVYWPAFLMAAELAPPKQILAHGWWTNEGEKISKSLGNVINPEDLKNEFGLDQTRYFLMREMAFGSDGNYSRSSMVSRSNNELANNVGNLFQRSLNILVKNSDSEVQFEFENEKQYSENELIKFVLDCLDKYHTNFLEHNFHKCLSICMELASECNAFIDRQAPWKQRKEDINQMHNTLGVLVEALRYLSIMFLPFIPDSANELLNQLNINENERNFSALNYANKIKKGHKISDIKPVFKKIEENI